jgi:hypothetical protein
VVRILNIWLSGSKGSPIDFHFSTFESSRECVVEDLRVGIFPPIAIYEREAMVDRMLVSYAKARVLKTRLDEIYAELRALGWSKSSHMDSVRDVDMTL